MELANRPFAKIAVAVVGAIWILMGVTVGLWGLSGNLIGILFFPWLIVSIPLCILAFAAFRYSRTPVTTSVLTNAAGAILGSLGYILVLQNTFQIQTFMPILYQSFLPPPVLSLLFNIPIFSLLFLVHKRFAKAYLFGMVALSISIPLLSLIAELIFQFLSRF